ncbi:YdcF family protein [Staphylococcus schleiferi]|uniref:YdcF family protein n=1 Tax=Staphylococcus schleiferi TaxID=1295 RepID=UPI0018877EA0|nr:YdcF family protein [Staphylococcus schleiferi]MBF1993726.1 YdcF family protein [Staphylococcus schleiferi]MBF2039457.1 YdcF family protein [Staphylococcus schleiferi]MBF2101268.1 YdcF family protein [Staphylococcus schleiferi]MBF2103429.1 YdcF family protein [Staphylococcus schleiferi]MBF2105565.1 YdcF family protein [Staphylococcus schleiferi]
MMGILLGLGLCAIATLPFRFLIKRNYTIKYVLLYHFMLISLILGYFFVKAVIPSVLTLPFDLLINLTIVFVASWQCYLLMTYQFKQVRPLYQNPTILILGAGIFTERVTPLLKSRLDAAMTLIPQGSSQFKLIMSGGQGPDEPIPEALAMQRYLIQHGISPQHIVLEDASTNTQENIIFSKAYLDASDIEKLVIVTSDFHIMRALRIAQREGIQATGFGAPTPRLGISLLHDYCGLLFKYPFTWWIFGIVQVLIGIYGLLM